MSDGSAGFALTFGLGAVTGGATLEWNNQNWTGSCDDSSTLVPENPVPAPSGVAVLLAGGAWAARRRRA